MPLRLVTSCTFMAARAGVANAMAKITTANTAISNGLLSPWLFAAFLFLSPPRKRGSRAGDGAVALDSRFRGNDKETVAGFIRLAPITHLPSAAGWP